VLVGANHFHPELELPLPLNGVFPLFTPLTRPPRSINLAPVG
jgi:hypothetical protein